MTEPSRTPPNDPVGRFLVLYDGVCGLCNRSVRFLLRHDRGRRLEFAALQSPIAAEILARHGGPADLSTMALVENLGRSEERLVLRSQAALEILAAVGGLWRIVSWLRVIPRPLRDAVYRWVGRHRYRWFGRSEQCELPVPEHLARFVDRPGQDSSSESEASERSQALASDSSGPSK